MDVPHQEIATLEFALDWRHIRVKCVVPTFDNDAKHGSMPDHDEKRCSMSNPS